MIGRILIDNLFNYSRDKYLKYRYLFLFLFRLALLYIGFFVFYSFFRYSLVFNGIYEYSTEHLTNLLLKGSKFILDIFGVNTEMHGKSIFIPLHRGIFLDRGCVGRNVMAVYVGFLVAYPGNWKSKFLIIPIGLLIINILNSIRIALLVIIINFYPSYFDINHKFIFQVIVYTSIFLIWSFWIRRYGVKKLI